MNKYLSFFVGTAILSFGLFNIHSRCLISEGGVLGASLLLYHWFHISPGINNFVLDCSCFLIGVLVLGRGFLRDSLIASGMFSLWYGVWEMSGPILPDLSAMPLVACVLGGIFVGTGAGLVVRHDCAAGGDDALALAAHYKFGIKVSRFYNLSDFTILLLSLSYIPFRRIAWSLLSVLISSWIIELLRPRGRDTVQ